MDDATIEVRQTEEYVRWFDGLRDRRAKSRIDFPIRRMALDSPGDVRHVGGRVSEARIDYGPGYRIYFVREGRSLIILVGGGDKGSQARDIERAQRAARALAESRSGE